MTIRPIFKYGCSMGFMTPKEYNELLKNCIKEWHFERSSNGKGVIPFEEKYDPTNPKHNIYHKKHITNPDEYFYKCKTE